MKTENMGRPEVWTPEYVAEVAAKMHKYVDETLCPTEAEFCFLFDIRFQRLAEHEALIAEKERLFAKRQAYVIKCGVGLEKGENAKGSFLQKLAANAGAFSLTDKQAIEHSGSVQIIDDVK